MDQKMIQNNHDLATLLCKRFLNIELYDFSFKPNGYDEQIYLTYNGNNYIIYYDDVNQNYVLLHRSTGANKKQSHHYHKEFTEMSLISLVKKLSTRHNVENMNKNRDTKIDKMMNLMKNPPRLELK